MEASRATSNCSTAQQSFADLHTAGITSQMLENNGEAAPTGGAPDAKKRQADAEEARLKREHQIEKEDDTDSNTIDSKREVETTFYNRMSVVNLIRERCSETISHDQATIPLAWQAMLTGLVDALLYTRFTVWTGFQTGNMVQFSENIAQYMLPNETKMPLLTLLRSLSVCSFLIGSFLGSRLGARFGDRKRGWQVSTSIIQSLFLFGASAILLSRPAQDESSFRFTPGVVIMTALSMGMQSIAAQKFVSPAFATTVAFTATLSQIASDPYLFAFTLAPVEQYHQYREEKKRQLDENEEANIRTSETSTKPKQPPKTLGRDRRLLGIFSLCTGGGIAQCLLYSRANLRGGLTIAAGFKMIQALLWFFAPRGEKPASKNKS